MIQLDDDFSVEFVPEHNGIKVLGTILSLTDATKVEVTNRIATGWRAFWSLKRMLLNRRVSVHRRLKLFDATVGSCVLWGTQSWTPRADEFRLLASTRHTMLRRVAGSRRLPEETWLEWIRRTTHTAVGMAEAAPVRDWELAQWQRAGYVARRPATSWLWRLTTWRDAPSLALAHQAGLHLLHDRCAGGG